MMTLIGGIHLHINRKYTCTIQSSYLPVLRLVDSLGVGLGELALAVERGDGRRELGHGVHLAGQVVQHGHHVRRQLSPAGDSGVTIYFNGDILNHLHS